MNLPLFYTPFPLEGILPPQEAHHAARVLRVRSGTPILVTDGKGACYKAVLKEVTAKKVSFEPGQLLYTTPRPFKVKIAVAPTRKAERNEWMLEKLVEFGIDEVWFIKSAHTHRETFSRVVNPERMEKIAISAMKQSGQFSLPSLHFGMELSDLFAQPNTPTRFIAYVPDKASATHLITAARNSVDTLVLIGPEGDFTPGEVEEAFGADFRLVSLGTTRLRTETAAIAACHAIHLANVKA